MEDSQSLSEWMQGASFAIYAWNYYPIYSTDIIRSFAHKVSTFSLDFDLILDPLPRM